MKTKKCSACSADIAKNANVCPHCGANNKTPVYKKWWFWGIIVIVVIAIASGSSGGNETEVNNDTTSVNQTNNQPGSSESKTEDQKVPAEYKSALKKAEIYSDTMHMSKAGIYQQLTSEYGEKFSAEAAQYAIDNIDADWKANALEKAKVYQDTMSMSPSAIHDQLTSEYGEKFTQEEADYAIANLE